MTLRIDSHRVDDTLTLVLTGRLDATTAPELGRALGLDGISRLVLDLGACPYVSSGGLREFLRARKQMATTGGSILLSNVTREVQDVLDMTGFSKLIPSSRKVREISLDGLEFLSAGVCGECYRLDAETIVKLYNEGVDPQIAEKEKEFARAAFVSGIPTAISYDVVSCGTRTGVVYEMLHATLFSTMIRNDLANIDRHARLFADINRTVHATPADPLVFPDIKKNFHAYLSEMDFFLSADDIALLRQRLDTIPDADTCVHFDLHTSNIMIRDNEPVIIDMGDMSRGHYLFDIGLLGMIYDFPELGLCELATKIPEADGMRLWRHFLTHYFADKPASEYEFFDRNKYFLASLRLIYTITFLPKLKDRMVHAIRDIVLPRIRAEG